MTGFDAARKVEAKGMAELSAFFREHSLDGRFVLTDKGPQSRFLQETLGDVVLQAKNRECWTVEVKTERENRHGNFFLETWSNRPMGPLDPNLNLGWLYKLRCDVLLYFFIESGEIYSVPFGKLRYWCFCSGWNKGIYAFDEKPQATYQQLNNTFGRCVPIDVIRREVGLTEYRRKSYGVFERVSAGVVHVSAQQPPATTRPASLYDMADVLEPKRRGMDRD